MWGGVEELGGGGGDREGAFIRDNAGFVLNVASLGCGELFGVKHEAMTVGCAVSGGD